MKKCDIVKSTKTIYEINENVTLHLQYGNCRLEVLGLFIPVSSEKIHWGPHSKVLFQHYVDQQTLDAIVQAVYEFHNPVKIECDEAVRA